MEQSFSLLVDNIQTSLKKYGPLIDKSEYVSEWVQTMHLVKGWLVIQMVITMTKQPELSEHALWFWCGFYGWLYEESNVSPVAHLVYQAYQMLLKPYQCNIGIPLPSLNIDTALQLLNRAKAGGAITTIDMYSTDDVNVSCTFVGQLLAYLVKTEIGK